jgi:hypothetical protein
VITKIYNKKTKEPTLVELFTATGKLKKLYLLTTRDACSEIRTKQTFNAKQASQFFNVKTWCYVKKPPGFKR